MLTIITLLCCPRLTECLLWVLSKECWPVSYSSFVFATIMSLYPQWRSIVIAIDGLIEWRWNSVNVTRLEKCQNQDSSFKSLQVFLPQPDSRKVNYTLRPDISPQGRHWRRRADTNITVHEMLHLAAGFPCLRDHRRAQWPVPVIDVKKAVNHWRVWDRGAVPAAGWIIISSYTWPPGRLLSLQSNASSQVNLGCFFFFLNFFGWNIILAAYDVSLSWCFWY